MKDWIRLLEEDRAAIIGILSDILKDIETAKKLEKEERRKKNNVKLKLGSTISSKMSFSARRFAGRRERQKSRECSIFQICTHPRLSSQELAIKSLYFSCQFKVSTYS